MKLPEKSLPLEITEDKAVEIAIVDKAKRKYSKTYAEAKALERFGVKTYRIKARTQAALGNIADKLGTKKIGHGKIMVASENAEEVIARITDYIEELKADPAIEPKVIVDLMQLLRDFNKQLLESGQAHINAERASAGITEMANLNIPFPAGTPMVIAIKSNGTNAVEPTAQDDSVTDIEPSDIDSD